MFASIKNDVWFGLTASSFYLLLLGQSTLNRQVRLSLSPSPPAAFLGGVGGCPFHGKHALQEPRPLEAKRPALCAPATHGTIIIRATRMRHAPQVCSWNPKTGDGPGSGLVGRPLFFFLDAAAAKGMLA